MKKILLMFVLFILAFTMAIVPAFAENDTIVNDTVVNETADNNDTVDVNETDDDDNVSDVDSDDELELDDEDVVVFSTNDGATVRLLQLERSLLNHLSIMQQIIDRVDDSEDLEIIYGELFDLKDDVRAEIENIDGQSVNSFTEFKHSANELSKKFREALKEVTTESEREEIKDSLAVDEGTQEEIAEVTAEIKDHMDGHNLKRMRILFENFGADNSEILKQLQAGEITVEEAKDQLKDLYKGFSKEKKENAKQKFKEHKAKIRVKDAAIRDSVKEDFKERIEERKSQWEEKRDEYKDQFQEHKKEWEEKRDAARERLDDRREAQKDRFEEHREDQKERLDDRREAQKDRFEEHREDQKDQFDARREAQKERLDDLKDMQKERFEDRKDSLVDENDSDENDSDNDGNESDSNEVDEE